MDVVCLKASQVAAVAGLHKYRNVDFELLELWHACDRLGCEAGMDAVLRDAEGQAAAEADHARVVRAVAEVAARTDAATAAAELQSVLAERVPDDIREAVASEVYKARGTEAEQRGLDRIQADIGSPVLQRNEKLYRKDVVLDEDMSAVIIGRVDGIDVKTGDLVEVKHRQRCFFEPLPAYDVVQAQVYLWLTGAPRCRFVQVLDGERRTDLLEPDPGFLAGTVWPGVAGTLRRLRALTGGDAAAAAALREAARAADPRRLREWGRGVLRERRARAGRRSAASAGRR
jgi:hypothetical protein